MLADAYTSQMGRSFSVQFPLRNPLAVQQQLSLVALANQVNAVVVPSGQIFGPLQQLVGTLSVHVPPNQHGTPAAPVRLDVTIVGRDASGKLLDGLTYVVWVDD